ncbi:hypothetical protein B0H66DRAFT_572268 [Apodospora peruviana]|uniref:Fatty acid desaturase domain-containing protein n=1 Tax=Apodospora peruviana TaxID=516989 RepID=A0AAE0MF84_9PEZI|nr:hypothetical protein B0H66DRAFT_572268 [Apodospora peruviana]
MNYPPYAVISSPDSHLQSRRRTFEPVVISTANLTTIRSSLNPFVYNNIMRSYIRFALSVVRHDSDVLMLTHIILYSDTLVPRTASSTADTPSSITFFPYIIGPLMGQTWHSFYYHHKMHHREGNGPNDLSSTMRYRRDSIWYFTCYFLLFLSRAGAPSIFSRRESFLPAAVFAFVLPALVLRLWLMMAIWDQHAFIDRDELSNRHCFNDGYHTSHLLNPRRYWRDHPTAFLQQKGAYAKKGSIVLHSLDYVMLAIRLFMKDYDHLARCMIPLGDQTNLTMQERKAFLKSLTRPFTQEELLARFRRGGVKTEKKSR